ncbi:MAG: competence/damage-inducible protein A, partial [Calditrichaeota bacterium]
IISIGNELLNGNTVNSNATFIARRLHETGVDVVWVQTIRDVAADITHALETATGRADIMMVTGGLGPTHDDVTKKVVADFFDSELIFNEEVFKQVKERFEGRGVRMPEVNRSQAMVPKDARLMSNPAGTAPGLIFEENDKLLFVMPGVPREMKSIMEESVIPFLKKHCLECHVQVDFFRTTGIAESAIYEELEKELEQFKSYEIAFLPGYNGVDMRVIRSGADMDNQEKFDKFKNILYNHIGVHIYSTDRREMEEVLGGIFRERGLTVAVAESLTGGLVQDRLTNVSGSSEYYMGGVVAYSNEAKISLLKVSKATLKEHGAVSGEVAGQMAQGVCKVFGTDVGISTTGIAGPTGGTETKPVGLVYVGMSYRGEVHVRKHLFGKNRDINKQRSAQAAMELARRVILELPLE